LRYLWRLIRGCRTVTKLCREKNIDVIHANDNTVAFFAVLPAKRLEIKSVWHVRSPVSRLGMIGAYLIKHCSVLVSCSQATAEPFIESSPECGEKTFVAYDGVDVSQLLERSAQASIREEYEISPDTPLVGVAGRITRSKGQDVFIKAAVVVSELHPKARFIVAGGPVAGSREALAADEGFGQEIRRLAEKVGIAEKVIFTGYRHDTPAVMKDLNVLVVPSRREPLGLVALEAMALGVPVVASNVDGLRESIESETNGLLVPADAAGALGMAISRLLKDRTLAKRLAEEGRRTVGRRFTADAHASAVADIYRVMLRTDK
jgi:glycosyltransferase involved in cell wall biosynthesis